MILEGWYTADTESNLSMVRAEFGHLRMTKNRALHVAIMEDATKANYSASTGLFTPAATATDILNIAGSATKTVKVTRVTLSGLSTVAGSIMAAIIKRSTANSGGTSSAVTAIPFDSGFAAASASLLTYTANPTVGTPVGTILQSRLNLLTVAVLLSDTVFDLTARPVILRGTTETLSLSLLGAALPAGAAISNATVEWSEI